MDIWNLIILKVEPSFGETKRLHSKSMKEREWMLRSSIGDGGTGTFSNFMATLAL